MAWQIAHGETPDNIRNHPALKGVTIPRTGRQGRIGTLVTKTLVVAGEGGRVHAARRPARRDAARLRQGQRQGDGRRSTCRRRRSGSPMTYLHNGQQYIVLAISAPPNLAAELIAFKLPQNRRAGHVANRDDAARRPGCQRGAWPPRRGMVAASPAAQEPRFSGPSSQALHQLFNDYWEWRLATEPELATQVGRTEHNGRWSRPVARRARPRPRRAAGVPRARDVPVARDAVAVRIC